jgi:ribosomal protein S18 acetylase RimI-like enzyme
MENGTNITFRDGQMNDCLRIAEFITIASGGVVDFLFQDLTPDLTPAEAMAGNLARDKEPFTFRNAIVAESGRETFGMALSYPSVYHGISDGMRAFFPADRLELLADFYASRVEDSLYLDAIAVDEAFRSHGIGRRLIYQVKEKALRQGLRSVSLIAFADNDRARRLYYQLRFHDIKHIPLDSQGRIPHEGGFVLMACEDLEVPT